MPKSRRDGRKYHLRKITPQLYAPPPSDNLLGVDYYSDSDCGTADQNLQVTHSINRYVLEPIEVTIATVHPSAIPMDDPRYIAYILGREQRTASSK